MTLIYSYHCIDLWKAFPGIYQTTIFIPWVKSEFSEYTTFKKYFLPLYPKKTRQIIHRWKDLKLTFPTILTRISYELRYIEKHSIKVGQKAEMSTFDLNFSPCSGPKVNQVTCFIEAHQRGLQFTVMRDLSFPPPHGDTWGSKVHKFHIFKFNDNAKISFKLQCCMDRLVRLLKSFNSSYGTPMYDERFLRW